MLVQDTAHVSFVAPHGWDSKPSGSALLPKQSGDSRNPLTDPSQSPNAMATLHTELDHRTNVYKPTRLNFARLCLYCDETDCTSEECIDRYNRSRWAICPECNGGRDIVGLCGYCIYGVEELCSE
ncbi:hypothetical protein [Flindersiella endophytica]